MKQPQEQQVGEWGVFADHFKPVALILHPAAMAFAALMLLGSDMGWFFDIYSPLEFLPATGAFLLLLASAYSIMPRRSSNWADFLWSISFLVHGFILFFGLLLTFVFTAGHVYGLILLVLSMSTLMALSVKAGVSGAPDLVGERFVRTVGKRRKDIFIGCSILFVVFSIFVHLNNRPVTEFPQLQGSLIDFRSVVEVFDFGTGLETRDSVFGRGDRPVVKCAGPSGSLIMSRKRMFVYSPFDDSLQYIERFDDTSYYCRSLDYDPQANQYVFSGRYEGIDGVFLLDSSFVLLSDYTSAIGELSISRPEVFFLGSSSLLCATFKDGCHVFDVHNESSRLLSDRPMCAISNNRRFVVCYQAEKNIAEGIYVVDIETGQERELSLREANLRGVIVSPDDRYLVISVMTYNLADMVINYLYDLETDEYVKMRVFGIQDVWVEQRHPSLLEDDREG